MCIHSLSLYLSLFIFFFLSFSLSLWSFRFSSRLVCPVRSLPVVHLRIFATPLKPICHQTSFLWCASVATVRTWCVARTKARCQQRTDGVYVRTWLREHVSSASRVRHPLDQSSENGNMCVCVFFFATPSSTSIWSPSADEQVQKNTNSRKPFTHENPL